MSLLRAATPSEQEARRGNRESDAGTARRGVLSQTTHWGILLGSALIVVLASTMSIEGGEKVTLPGMASPLPELCHLKRVTGWPCPGCGLTRSFISMGQARLGSAAAYNLAGVPLYLLVLFQIPYRLYWIVMGTSPARFAALLKWETAIVVALLVVMMTQWGLRLGGWIP